MFVWNAVFKLIDLRTEPLHSDCRFFLHLAALPCDIALRCGKPLSCTWISAAVPSPSGPESLDVGWVYKISVLLIFVAELLWGCGTLKASLSVIAISNSYQHLTLIPIELSHVVRKGMGRVGWTSNPLSSRFYCNIFCSSPFCSLTVFQFLISLVFDPIVAGIGRVVVYNSCWGVL